MHVPWRCHGGVSRGRRPRCSHLAPNRPCSPRLRAPRQAFFCSRQFRRCLQLLRGTELVEKDLRFRYLAAR